MKTRLLFIASLMFSSVIATESKAQEMKIEDSPVAVASFGAAVCGDYLYLFGGNFATAHAFSLEGQNDKFRRIKLETGAPWEDLGTVDRRQGNALVAHDGKVYQIGGFEARNKQGEEQDMHSSADFRMFDPSTMKWNELADLPEPRSSFDAVVMGDTLFVVGGWSLNGEGNETAWHQTAWKFDLSQPDGSWQAIKDPPVIRRADSLAHFQGKVYVIGGMKQRGGPTTEVAVYDPKSDTWQDGPSLPGEAMEGFGNSSFNVNGRLLVSTASGKILQLSADGSQWKTIHQLESGRFFHRMLPIDDHQIAILCGVAGDRQKQTSIIVLDLNKTDFDSQSNPSPTASTDSASPDPASPDSASPDPATVETLPVVDEKYDAELAKELGADEYGMKSYVFCILKTGPTKLEDPDESRTVYAGHFSNMAQMAEAGQLVLAGPLADAPPRRGIYIFNVSTIEAAEELVKSDPAVVAGVFEYELMKLYSSAALMQINEIHQSIQKTKIE